MKTTVLTAGLIVVALGGTAWAQNAPLSAETQSGSNMSAGAVTPSASASTSASTRKGASKAGQQANTAAANASDPKRAVQTQGRNDNIGASASGNVVPNGSTTSSPAGAGASSEATLNEHGETGTASGNARTR